MKKAFIIIALFSNIIWSEEFISQYEYGQMLYASPRGVSCQKCHGKIGKRHFITSFREKNGTIKSFYAPDIKNLTFKEFSSALKSGGKIMPRYYLTKKEIEAIYKYIQIVNKPIKVETIKEEENKTFCKQEKNETNKSNIENIESFDINESSFYKEEGIERDQKSREESLEEENNENSSIISKLFNDLKKDEKR